MLKSISLKNFKSFDDASVRIESPFVLLVGANGSGKSNLLDAIRFLQGCARDMSIADVLSGRTEGGKEVWSGIRGGPLEATRNGSGVFTIETEWGDSNETVAHTIACATTGQPHLERESLSAPGVSELELFNTHGASLKSAKGEQAGGAMNVAIKRASGKGSSVSKKYSASRSLLNQVENDSSCHPSVYTESRALVERLRGATFLNIAPQVMRDYVPKHQSEQLDWQGENLSAVLWKLCQDRETRDELVDWLSELLAPELADIAFAETDFNDVMVALVERGGKRVSAKSLSDGTLRFLGELVALRTARPGTLLLLEEIENGLHPRRAELIVEMFDRLTAERGIQVLATTHSPVVLDALSPKARQNAIIFARDPDSMGTVMRRLGDLLDFDTLYERKGIDYMMRTGWLERAI